MFNLNVLKNKLSEVEKWLSHEYQSLRTGRATPAVLDPVNVDMYGSQSKISHLAAISIEDARTLRIAPYDKSAVRAIESALQAANLGISVIVDGSGLRVSFPELNSERRKVLERLIKEKHEEARVKVRREREDILNDVTKREKDGEISEDEKFTLKEDLQKMVDLTNNNLEVATARKQQEISE
ncbi:MAG: ribosome recycling factor [Patescibacteria group bacterium]